MVCGLLFLRSKLQLASVLEHKTVLPFQEKSLAFILEVETGNCKLSWCILTIQNHSEVWLVLLQVCCTKRDVKSLLNDVFQEISPGLVETEFFVRLGGEQFSQKIFKNLKVWYFVCFIHQQKRNLIKGNKKPYPWIHIILHFDIYIYIYFLVHQIQKSVK